jgi:tripeptide aminopeptidase
MTDPAVAELMNLLAIAGPSTEEQAMAAHIGEVLRQCGVPAQAMRHDRTFEQSEYGGTVGNLIVHLPRRGGHPGAARLFMTHMDTVSLCRGGRPRFVPAGDGKPARIVNDNPDSALGADCRTGIGALLHLARFLAACPAHPSIWMVFTVQEELGLIGARGLDLGALQPDPPLMGFNYDGALPDHVVTAIIGTTRFFIDLHGKAAHTGINPQEGLSTAAAEALALADMVRGGWHGRIVRPEGRGSANIGVLHGGEMTNTVMEKLIVRGEARSHDPAFRRQIVEQYRAAFQRAADATRNVSGECVRMSWKLGPCYESFALPPDAPVVQEACAALRSLGVEPVLEINDGGMDNNWINARGLPTVSMGTGQHGAHTVAEWINVDEYLLACRASEKLALQA